jgi:hypothetical protein
MGFRKVTQLLFMMVVPRRQMRPLMALYGSPLARLWPATPMLIPDGFVGAEKFLFKVTTASRQAPTVEIKQGDL